MGLSLSHKMPIDTAGRTVSTRVYVAVGDHACIVRQPQPGRSGAHVTVLSDTYRDISMPVLDAKCHRILARAGA